MSIPFFASYHCISASTNSHKGCKCPPEFEGEHCEYLKGFAPVASVEPDVVKKEEESQRTYVEPAVPSSASVVASEALTEEHMKASEELAAPHNSYPKNTYASPDDSVFHAKTYLPKDTTSTTAAIPNVPMPTENSAVTKPKLPSVTSVPPSTLMQKTALDDNNSSSGSIVGLLLAITGLTAFALAVVTRKRKQQRIRGRSIAFPEQHLASLDRDNYQDETPIRVRVMSDEEEDRLELDEVMGEDDDVVSIGECSLEEIELDFDGVASNYREYLEGVRDEGFESCLEDRNAAGGEGETQRGGFFA
jgi:hypothetical protein